MNAAVTSRAAASATTSDAPAAATSDTSAGAKAGNVWSLLRERNFRLLWIGETTSSLGSNVTSVALPLVALAVLHASVFEVSVLTAAVWLPWLVIGLPAGAWVDRLRRRPLMIGCDLASVAAFVSVPAAAAAGALTMTQLIAVALVAGVAKVFFSTAYSAFLPAVVGRDRLLDANAALRSSESGTQIIGPGLGGVIAQAVGAVVGLIVDAATFVVSLVCLLQMRTPEPRTAKQKTALRRDIAEGLRFVLHDRLLTSMVLFGAAANLALTAYNAIQLTFLVDAIHVAPSTAGLLFAVASAGGVIGALAAPRLARRWGSARTLLLSKVALTPAVLLVPLTTNGVGLVFFLVGTVAMVTGVVAGNVLSQGFVQGYCPPGLRGRVSSCLAVVNYSSIPIGALAGGALAQTLGFRPALWLIFGAFIAAGGILVASPLRRMRDLPTAPAR